MEVLRTIPLDGTFNQTAPLERLVGISKLRSFDLSSATDRFPLSFQQSVISCLFSFDTAFAWIASGLGTNVFSAP